MCTLEQHFDIEKDTLSKVEVENIPSAPILKSGDIFNAPSFAVHKRNSPPILFRLPFDCWCSRIFDLQPMVHPAGPVWRAEPFRSFAYRCK